MLPDLISYYIRRILFDVPPKTKGINFPMLQRLGSEMTIAGKHFPTIESEFVRRLLFSELVF